MANEKVIQIRKDLSSPYNEWVGIGGKDYDPQAPEDYILPSDVSEEGWFNFFNESSPGDVIDSINFIDINDCTDLLPDSVKSNFIANREQIQSLVSNWYHSDSSLFKFLDFLIEDPDYELIKYDETEIDTRQRFIPADKEKDLLNDCDALREILIAGHSINSTNTELKLK